METPNPFALTFASPELETGFEREYRREPRAYYRMLALAILGFLLIISVTGLLVAFSVNREGIQRLLWFALIPVTAAAALGLHVPAASRHQRSVVVAFVAALGAVCIAWPFAFADRFITETYGFSYLAFVLLLSLAFGRFSPRGGVLLAGALIGAYASACAAVLGAPAVLAHVPLLLGAAAIGFAVGFVTERNMRLLYAARALAEDRERRLIESEARLREEQARSEELILSMLPASVADRLRTEGKSIADGIAECTVLFADIVGFSGLSRELGPRALVNVLNRLFTQFDELCARHGLEKIKTIGDAYMAAASVPDYAEDHAACAADMALAMIGVVERESAASDLGLDVRVGVHSGPVIAGIIGTPKFAYDLWGETVNTASRMESHGEPGRVQLSEASALLVRRSHVIEERGVIEVKGKGPMKTYWLVARKAPAPNRGSDAARKGVS